MAATGPVHGQAVASVLSHAWGPPALNYPVAATLGAGGHLGAGGVSGTAGSSVSIPAAYGAASPSSDTGAFTPMTHCSKMPHIMDLKSH